MNDVLFLIAAVSVGAVLAFYDVGTGTWRSLTPATPGELSIVSFNTAGFSDDGFANATERSWYASLITTTDILGLQEVRGERGGVAEQLSKIAPGDHEVFVSDALGRTQYYTERYVYVVNTSAVQVDQTRVMASVNESVNRPPFTLTFTWLNESFKAYNVHTDPETASEEIVRVADRLSELSAEQRVALGDFNADCDYYDPRRGVRGLTWVVSSSADTTTSQTDCAYDRVLVGDAALAHHRTSTVIDIPSWLSDHKPVRTTFGAS